MNKPVLISILALSFVLFGTTSCMKTRTQIKNEQGTPENTETEERTNQNYEDIEMKNEIARISGKLEQVEHSQKSQNYAELKEYAVKLDNRIAELEKNQILLLSEVKALKDKEEQIKKEAALKPEDLMKEGYALLAQKNYAAAAEKFRILNSKNLKDKEKADAHFGLGESEYGLKEYKKAIVEYSKVSESSVKSKHAPTSLFKIGLSFKKLGMNKEAKSFFSELRERFPKSKEAKMMSAGTKE